MLDQLRAEVYEANLELVHRGLVLYTFGNASGRDPSTGLIVIKPSGVDYDHMTHSDMVVTGIDGKIVEGDLRPSSDLATHLEIYKAFPGVGGVVHTHSPKATAWAQAGREIPCFGTTHADYFHGPIPVTEPLTEEEVRSAYELNTGRAIVRRFAQLDPLAVPAVLVAGHAPFTWGKDAASAAYIATVLERVAAMALETLLLNPQNEPIPQYVLDKHYLRKHGKDAYYGQDAGS
jgi:L-ribulose-5-phosphate 4-epimerase